MLGKYWFIAAGPALLERLTERWWKQCLVQWIHRLTYCREVVSQLIAAEKVPALRRLAGKTLTVANFHLAVYPTF